MPEKIDKNNISKQVLYRSTHRGCKETDFLIGKFVEANLKNFDEKRIELLAVFLQEDDLKIYDWILKKDVTPASYLELVEEICQFHKI